MAEEFYHKNIFGTVVDIDLNAEEQEEKILRGKTGREFNVFTLTDAFGARRKKEAWVIYQKALSLGVSAEEVFFKLFWLVKSMLIVLKTKSVTETDMKIFPYNKAKGFLVNFSPGELEKLSEDLVIGYHEVRSGRGEINVLIEKILLSL